MDDENIYHIRMAFGDPGPQESAVILTIEFENCDILTEDDRKDFAMGLFNVILREAGTDV